MTHHDDVYWVHRMEESTAPTNGNTELIEFLQGHFTKVDAQFVKIDEHFTKVDAQLMGLKLDVGEVNEGLRKVNERIDGLYTLIDSFVKLHQKLDIELVALRDKYNRLSKAHNELAAEYQQLTTRVARLEGTPA